MKISKKVVIAFTSLLVTVGAITVLNVSGAETKAVSAPGTRRDCTAEDILYCGALSQTELLQKYDANNAGVQSFFTHFGIKRSDLASSTVKMGTLKTDGTIVVDGKTVAKNAVSTYRIRTKAEAKPITVNGTTYYTLPVNGVYRLDADVFVMFKNGKFFQAIQSSCGNIITGAPEEPVKPEPVYSCDRLTAKKIERNRFEFNSSATAKNGAKIVNYTYDFGDGKKLTNNANTVHTYTKPGTYTVTVTVNVEIDGKTYTDTGSKCKVTIKVEPVPVKPLYECKSLTARIVKAETRTYEYTLTYKAENGAMLKKVDYDFGDGKKITANASNASKVTHSYAKAGAYRTTATLHFSVKEGNKTVEKNIKCEVEINTSPEVCPYDSRLPKNSPDCERCPYNQELPKNSDQCKEEETPEVPELPQTGIGGMLSGIMGLGSLSAAGYYFVASRKNLMSSLLNR